MLIYDRNLRHAVTYSLSSPLKIFDLAKSQGRLLYACAPMVRYSKLAFRQTVHAYGTDLCWTPMILAKEFNRSFIARDSGEIIHAQAASPHASSPRREKGAHS